MVSVLRISPIIAWFVLSIAVYCAFASPENTTGEEIDFNKMENAYEELTASCTVCWEDRGICPDDVFEACEKTWDKHSSPEMVINFCSAANKEVMYNVKYGCKFDCFGSSSEPKPDGCKNLSNAFPDMFRKQLMRTVCSEFTICKMAYHKTLTLIKNQL